MNRRLADIRSNPRLLATDLGLLAATAAVCALRAWSASDPPSTLILVFLVYLGAKVIGYAIADYSTFARFIQDQVRRSRRGAISGFALFKATLVFLLLAGFLFVHPTFWLVESVLVVVMRIWVRCCQFEPPGSPGL